MNAYEISYTQNTQYATDAKSAILSAEFHIADPGDIRPYQPGVYRQAPVLKLHRAKAVLGVESKNLGATRSGGDSTQSFRFVASDPGPLEIAQIIVQLDDDRTLLVDVRNFGPTQPL